jgi:hypothetical protein
MLQAFLLGHAHGKVALCITGKVAFVHNCAAKSISYLLRGLVNKSEKQV